MLILSVVQPSKSLVYSPLKNSLSFLEFTHNTKNSPPIFNNTATCRNLTFPILQPHPEKKNRERETQSQWFINLHLALEYILILERIIDFCLKIAPLEQMS